MKPTIVGDLTFVKARHKSKYGTIRSEWEIRDNNFYWNISIPANTSAVVYIPAVNENEVTEHGIPATSADGVKFIEMSKQGAMFQLGSGDYQFTSSNYK
jgi:alpha-L-rhamnosidase